MDHLPYPTKASLPPLRIAYLCEEVKRYDDLGLRSFPLRAGWVNGSHSSPWYACHASARAQSWLYFGLLQELFGRAFDEREFLDSTATEQQFVTSERLPVLLNEWCPHQDGFNAPSTPREPTETNLERSLLRRYRTDSCEHIIEILGFVEEQSDIVDAEILSARLIVLSIKILIWSIRNSLFHHLPSLKNKKKTRLRQSRLLKSRMLEGGKCPYWTEVYLQRYSPALIYYLAATRAPSDFVNPVAYYLAATQAPGATLDPLDFPTARFTGEFISTVDAIRHTRCSTGKCVANDIDEQHYNTKHIWGDCECIFVTANIGKVVEIIQNGCVPLVEIKELPTGLLALDVVQAGHDVHYTAISHVWSGGLGNPTSNGLPQCQLGRLRRSLAGARRRARTDASESRPTVRFCGIRAEANDLRSKFQREIFWMDTFCIPVSLGKQLRRKAIAQMNFIYAGADNVLVIDPELQLAMWNSFSLLELRVQLLSSSWMTRCWTYQEARLARVWLVDVTTDLYNPIMELWDEILSQKSPTGLDESELEREAISVCEGLWPLSAPRVDLSTSTTLPRDDVAEFARIWCQLNERSTSHLADRLTILSILRDISVAEIKALGLQQRMQAILRSEDSLPLSLLFQTQPGPVVDDDKCRWVPVYPSGWMSTDYGCMLKSSDGSHFKISLSTIKARGFLMDAKDSAYHQFFIANETQGSHAPFEAWIEAVTHNSIARRSSPRSACIVLSSQPADFRDSQYRLAAARFYVEDVSIDLNSYTLVYDCPLVYTRTRPIETEPSSVCNEYPRVEVSLMPVKAKILLDCGKLSWPDTWSYNSPTNTTALDRFTKLVSATSRKDKTHRNPPNHGSPITSIC